MQRTEYWNQTRPTDTQLNWTESSKINVIRQRLRSSAQLGIAWGFEITVNSLDNTKIDVARGEGYSGGQYNINKFESLGSGERISTYTDTPSGTDDTGPAATGQGLADYTNGIKNYVSLVYTEVESEPLSERTYPFTVRDTVVIETFVVSVLTEAQWNVLSANSLNSRILVGIVTAKGAGVALTSADIQQFIQPKTHPTASNPGQLTGITIVDMADNMPLGTGTIRWDQATTTLYWTAPGDSEGTGIVINNSGTYDLESNNTNYWITLNVVFGSLQPLVSQSANISITTLYGRAIPAFSATDTVHRDLTGSGFVTPQNPHGLSLDDLSGGTFDHADLYHLNGISKDADADNLEPTIDGINDRILVNNPGGYRNSFLIDGVTYQTITGYSATTSGTVQFLAADVTGNYMIYLDSAGVPQKVYVGANFTPATLEIWDIRNEIDGTGTLTWNDANQTLTWQAQGDAVAGATVHLMGTWSGVAGMWGYYKVYSDNPNNWIIVRAAGILGGAFADVIQVDKNEGEHADDSILKLAIVYWDSGTETLSNLRDIRRFVTADNRPETEEEHDEDGRHSKALQQQLKVGVNNGAIYGFAQTNSGVYGRAHGGNVGVFGYASNETGVVGQAGTDYGVFGSAGDVYGVAGTAQTIGVQGRAAVQTGVYGSAPNIGIRGSANVNYGVIGVANAVYGVYGDASATAGQFDASHHGVVATVKTDYGVSAVADRNIGVYGVAGTNYGVYGSADNYGVAGIAISYAIYGVATDNYGGYFVANSVGATGVYAGIPVGYTQGTGGFFEALNTNGAGVHGYGGTVGLGVGVYGSAAYNGVYGDAVGTGVIGNADTMGVYGVAAAGGGTGVYGTGVSIGVHGTASTAGQFIGGSIGAYGIAVAATGTGGKFAGGSIALSLSCPSVGAPAATVTHMPLSYNGALYTVRLWQ